jgi:hypothetical protein
MVPIKTPEGQAELKTRARRVSQRHRTLLFLVDGQRGEDQVRRLALAAGVPESCFDDLVELGMIAPSEHGGLGTAEVDTDHVELPLDESASDDDSLLPATRTLQPDSLLGDSGAAPDADAAAPAHDGSVDAALEEARELLMRAVRREAPMVGTLTLLRLRGAHSRAELEALLPEVEFRINEPHRTLVAAQTLQHARHLLAQPADAAGSGEQPA